MEIDIGYALLISLTHLWVAPCSLYWTGAMFIAAIISFNVMRISFGQADCVAARRQSHSIRRRHKAAAGGSALECIINPREMVLQYLMH